LILNFSSQKPINTIVLQILIICNISAPTDTSSF
jgi:hypothetical protein